MQAVLKRLLKYPVTLIPYRQHHRQSILSCLCDRWDVITHTWSYLTPDELLDSIADRLWLAGTVADNKPVFIGLYWADEVSCHDNTAVAPIKELHFVCQRGSERYAVNGIVAGVTQAFNDAIEQVWIHGTINPYFFTRLPLGTFNPNLSEVYHSKHGFLPLWEWRCTRSEYAKLIETLHSIKVESYEQGQIKIPKGPQTNQTAASPKYVYGPWERVVEQIKKWLHI